MEVTIGNTSVEKFIKNLDKELIAKALRTIELLERFGNRLGMPHSKSMAVGIFELRVRGKKEIRILYCFHKHKIFLLHGFIKKTQKTSLHDMRIATKRMKDLKKYNI